MYFPDFNKDLIQNINYSYTNMILTFFRSTVTCAGMSSMPLHYCLCTAVQVSLKDCYILQSCNLLNSYFSLFNTPYFRPTLAFVMFCRGFTLKQHCIKKTLGDLYLYYSLQCPIIFSAVFIERAWAWALMCETSSICSINNSGINPFTLESIKYCALR